MKSTLYCLFLSICLHSLLQAQSGLEAVVIERYYVADANDSGTLNFPVPADAKTYRVYVDLATGWGLQAIFASTNLSTGEVDTLVIRSTTPFFNNEDRGRIFGYQIPTANLDENTVALDSWLSTGRPSSTSDGVLKPEDTNGAVPAFPNLDGLLQNNDPVAGIPMSIQDGNIPGITFPAWTLTGITLTDLAIFNDIDLAGDEMIIQNGALSNFSTPLQGPNANHRILIGQFTTAGTFSGQVNLQIRNMTTSVVQQWVAESPTPTQFTSPTLKWKINDPPDVVITFPADSTRHLSGDTVNVTADAMDADSSILQVEFFFNGVFFFTDHTAPYEATLIASQSGEITAVATGDLGGQATSDPVYIEVVPYRVRDITEFCNGETVCIPVEAFGLGINGKTGFDLVLTFDLNKVTPTGRIQKSNDLLNAAFFDTDYSIDLLQQEMLISIFLNANAPSSTTFSGIGDIICIEFLKRPAFHAIDSTTLWVTSFQESLASGGTVQFDSIPPGVFSTNKNLTFYGSLAFWVDYFPIAYDATDAGQYLISTISVMDDVCDNITGSSVQPNTEGAFQQSLLNGTYLTISRDIAPTTEVQSVINSFDAFLVRKVLKEDPLFIPDVFQMIAMDVNRDGVISAGDVSQINQRSVLKIDEFRQAWNYNVDGTPKPDYAPSKDWIFIGRNALIYDPSYTRSSTYPADDGTGFSKMRLPKAPFCIWTEIDDQPDVCPEQGIETYFGILLGDVNGNYAIIPSDGVLK